jgi:hypothetical protein
MQIGSSPSKLPTKQGLYEVSRSKRLAAMNSLPSPSGTESSVKNLKAIEWAE